MGHEKILIADDEPAITEYCTTALSGAGYDVAAAVFKGTGMNFIEWIFFSWLGSSDIDINSSDSGVGQHIIEPDLRCLDRRADRAKINEST